MEYCKLQIGCMLIVIYFIFIYTWERRAYHVKQRDRMFDCLIVAVVLCILFDGSTAYTVNYLESIPDWVNGLLHLGFFCSVDIMVYLMYLFVKKITVGIPKSRKKRFLSAIPLFLSLIGIVCFMPRIEYRKGEITNYSMGISVYICYGMLAIYMVVIVFLLVVGWKHLGRHKMITVSTYVAAAVLVAVYQMLHPEALLTCLVPTFAIIGIYLNMENPVFTKLQIHNQEMVMGFSTLVENRDDNTGGHIKRTTEYVSMLAEALRERGYYRETLTRDYIKNLVMAAPMHDLGKIAIPDAILQKPGKLTTEEYDVMKTHASRGGQIIQETFGSMGEDEYESMAYEVARHHHEKWNGKGYPDGYVGEQIPLCARIMAVADVFDAVSAKRCYRDALPLTECFQILERGRGEDFDPVIVDVFLDMKEEIEKIRAR